jgi:hypothetical protein
MKIKHVTREEIDDMMNTTVKHLNAVCKDFLCVSSPVTKELKGNATSYAYANQVHNLRIEFLYRTVYDFLRSDEMNHLLNDVVPAHFTTDGLLFDISVACVKIIIHDIDYGDFG